MVLSSPYTAMPTEQRTDRLDVVEDDRGRQLSSSRSARLSTSSGLVTWLMRTANSSPPRRTARSPSRTPRRSRSPNSASTWSPACFQRVVDALEVVDVEHQQGRGPAVPTAAVSARLAALDQQRAGAQRGEPVQHGRTVGRVDEPSLRLEPRTAVTGSRSPGRTPTPAERAAPPETLGAPGAACRPAGAGTVVDQLPGTTAGRVGSESAVSSYVRRSCPRRRRCRPRRACRRTGQRRRALSQFRTRGPGREPPR